MREDGSRHRQHLIRFRINLHESLAVTAVARLRIGQNGFAGKELFLLFLVVPLQMRGFEDRIKHHVRLPVVPADDGEAGAALECLSVLVSNPYREHGRMPPIAQLIQNPHRQILDHLLREPETG